LGQLREPVLYDFVADSVAPEDLEKIRGKKMQELVAAELPYTNLTIARRAKFAKDEGDFMKRRFIEQLQKPDGEVRSTRRAKFPRYRGPHLPSTRGR